MLYRLHVYHRHAEECLAPRLVETARRAGIASRHSPTDPRLRIEKWQLVCVVRL